MADSGRSAGGVAPRSRPSRVTPYGPSKFSHRRSIQYHPPAINPSRVPPRRGTTQYDPPRRGTKGISTQYDPPRRGTKGISTQYDPPPAIGPSKVFPSLRPEIGASNVPLRSNIQYHPPAIGPKFPPLLRPAMDLSKVPPCLHYLYPYALAFRFHAGLPASTPYDAPAIGPSYVAATPYDLPANLRSTPYDPSTTGTPCDPLTIGCHSSPPHDSPAIGCLNYPCDSPASSPSYLNNTPSPVSDSEITLDYDGRRCFICDDKRLHSSVKCPCLVLAAQLDVVKDNPPKEWEYYRYVVRNEWEGMDGYGVGFYDPLKKEDVERSAADAMRQYKDGMNMIRMTGLPENNRDPERLCRQLEKKFGPVAHAVVFPDQSFGFVKFVNRDSAEKAIEVLNNYSDCGHLMWAMQSPE